MTSDLFDEFYRQLASERSEPTKCLALLREFATACRDKKMAAASTDEWLTEVDNCLHEVAQSQTLFAAAVSRWLTVDEDVDLARALVHKASVRHLQQTVAVAYDLSNIDEASAILAGCRICARGATPAVSLGWTLSLSVARPRSDKTRRAVDHLLEYHVEEFPWTTRQLLASNDSPFKSLKKAKRALVVLEQQEAWLEGLPELREFAMTPEMRLARSSLKRRENRDIHRRSREVSVFSQFVTTQHFKYANKTAMEFVVGNQVQETTLTMSPYSVSVELPLSERTDPESGATRRKILWRGVPQ